MEQYPYNILTISLFNKEKSTLLGAFSKLRKGLLVFSCLSVRLFFRMEQAGPHWTDFHEILCLSVCRKSVYKSQSSLQSASNNGTSHKTDVQL